MNPTVKRIVDILFQDTVENEETNALHEELMNNCQEHFEDLTAQGLTEDEAIGAVVESLKGMKDVIDEYPKKEQAAAPADYREEKGSTTAADGSVYAAAGVNKLRVEATANDVTVVTAKTDRILIRCEDPEAFRVERSGDTLKIISVIHEKLENDGKSFFDSSVKADSVESFVSGVLNKVQRALNKAGISMTGEQPPIGITLPEDFAGSVNISSRSGDIILDGTYANSVSVHTVSGDIRVGFPGGHTADTLELNSTGGDISVTGNSKKLSVNTISGDLEIRGYHGKSHLKSVSGDIAFAGSMSETTCITVSGDIRINAENADLKEAYLNSVSGDLHLTVPERITAARVNITTRSGERYCRFGDTNADILPKITVTTVSGDVRID